MKRNWLVISAGVLVISVILDLLVVSGGEHATFPWSHVPAFFALFGFLGCLAIIYGAKLLGHRWLSRKEDYYNKDDEHK